MQPSKEYDYDPRNLPTELLAAIGLGIAAASQTEDIMAAAIGGCLSIDAEYSMAVTTHMTLPLRFSVLRSVAEIRIDDLDDLDKLDEILERIDDALNRRHALAHHLWCRDPETGQTFRSKTTSRARLEAELIPITTASVEKDAAFIYKAGMDMMRFLMRTGLLPPIPLVRPRHHKSKAARKKRRK